MGFVSYVAGFGAAIGYAVALKPAWGLEVPSFRPEKWGADPRVIVGGMILMLATGIVLSPVLERLPAEYFDRLDDYMKGGFWPMFTAVAVAPVVEEFLFRGIIQKNLVRRLGPFGGIAVGALLFGAVHVNPPQVVYASCLGLILGTVYYLSGSLNSAVTVHFVNNGLTSLLYMLFGTSVGLERRILGLERPGDGPMGFRWCCWGSGRGMRFGRSADARPRRRCGAKIRGFAKESLFLFVFRANHGQEIDRAPTSDLSVGDGRGGGL